MINHLCLLNFCCCLHELKLTFCRGDKSVREKAFELFKAESPVEVLVTLLHQRIQTQLSAPGVDYEVLLHCLKQCSHRDQRKVLPSPPELVAALPGHLLPLVRVKVGQQLFAVSVVVSVNNPF